MKLKTFSEFIINERIDQSEIDRLLDKISASGIESLSDYERHALDNADNDTAQPLLKMKIENIQSIVHKYGPVITMADLSADAPPTYREDNQEIHIIESLSKDGALVVAYGGYKYEVELNEYIVEYEKISQHIISDIVDLLDNAIQDGILEENV